MNPITGFLTGILPYLSMLIALGVVIGSVFQGYSKKAGEIQEKVIVAQRSQIETKDIQIETLETQVETRDKEIVRLKNEIKTTNEVLKREGIVISISEEAVYLPQIHRPANTIRKRPTKKTEEGS